jgi:hypothetical protein
MTLFLEMPHNFWWKLLPNEEEDLDLRVATRRPWEQLLPLLLESKLIRLSPKAVSISKYKMNYDHWEERHHHFLRSKERFEFTYYQ